MGNLYIVLSAICFAFGGLLIKINSWSALSINGVRSVFALFSMSLYLSSQKKKLTFSKTTLFCCVAHSLMAITFVMANKLTSAANAIVLQFTEPLFMVVLLFLLYKEKPNRNEIITCILTFTGIILVFVDDLSPGSLSGNLLAIFSGLMYAIVLMGKKLPDSDFESAVIYSYLISIIVSIPFLLNEGGFSFNNLLSCMLLGLFQIGLGYILMAKGLETVTPLNASFLSMIEPVLNPILVALFYGEKIGLIAILGACLVIISSVFHALKP